MAKGSTGTNTGIINARKVRKRKARPCNSKKCKFAKIIDNVANCIISGDVGVKKRTCSYYSELKES